MEVVYDNDIVLFRLAVNQKKERQKGETMCTKKDADQMADELAPKLRQEAVMQEIYEAKERGALSCTKLVRVGRYISVSPGVLMVRERLAKVKIPKVFRGVRSIV